MSRVIAPFFAGEDLLLLLLFTGGRCFTAFSFNSSFAFFRLPPAKQSPELKAPLKLQELHHTVAMMTIYEHESISWHIGNAVCILHGLLCRLLMLYQFIIMHLCQC